MARAIVEIPALHIKAHPLSRNQHKPLILNIYHLIYFRFLLFCRTICEQHQNINNKETII